VRVLKHFRRLQWKLTLSYTITTVLADMVLLLLLIVWLTYFIYSQFIGDVLASELAGKFHDDAVSYLTQTPPDQEGLHAWLDTLTQDGRLNSEVIGIGESGLSLLSSAQVQQLTVVDMDGSVLASVGAEAVLPEQALVPRLAPEAAVVLQTALTDPEAQTAVGTFGVEVRTPDEATDTTDMVATEGSPQLGTQTSTGEVMAAIPLINEQGQREGVLFAAVEQPFGALLIMVLGGTLSLFVFTALVSGVPAALVGALFGFMTARGLSRRLERLVVATAAWRQGDFRMRVTDRSHDEIGHLTGHLNEMATDLHTLLQVRQELAALEERNRLARDLHDAAKQQLFATVMQVNAARALLRQDVDAADDKLARAEQIVRAAQKELSLLIHELRPVALQQQILADALETYAEEWSRQSGIGLHYTSAVDREVAPAAEQAFFRVTQEALANVLRHSEATHIDITLKHEQDAMILTIADNGRGFDPNVPQQGGIGLHSMRERLANLGGTLTIESTPGHGTCIEARLPINAGAAATSPEGRVYD
jgi:NarL family two-component system sensor histidine kinase LiaS